MKREVLIWVVLTLFAGCIKTNSASRQANDCSVMILSACNNQNTDEKVQELVAKFFDDNFEVEELNQLQLLFNDETFCASYEKVFVTGDEKTVALLSERARALGCLELLRKLGDCASQLDDRFDEEINFALDNADCYDDNVLIEIESLINAQQEDTEIFAAQKDSTID